MIFLESDTGYISPYTRDIRYFVLAIVTAKILLYCQNQSKQLFGKTSQINYLAKPVKSIILQNQSNKLFGKTS
jgi:hypothetical protein